MYACVIYVIKMNMFINIPDVNMCIKGNYEFASKCNGLLGCFHWTSPQNKVYFYLSSNNLFITLDWSMRVSITSREYTSMDSHVIRLIQFKILLTGYTLFASV